MTKPAPISRIWPEQLFVTWVLKLPVPVELTQPPDWMPVLKVMCVTGRRKDFTAMYSLC